MPPRRPSNQTFARDRADQREDARITDGMRRNRDRFISGVEEAAARNPHINESVFRGIVEEYDRIQEQYRNDVIEARRSTLSNQHYRSDVSALQRRYYHAVRDRVRDRFGDDGMVAWNMVGRQLQPQSIFTPIVRMFYNSDNGGAQIGGMFGGAAGAGIGYYLSRGSNWMINGLATIVGGIVGAFLGNRLDGRGEELVRPDFHTPRQRTNTPAANPNPNPAPSTSPAPVIADAAVIPPAPAIQPTGAMAPMAPTDFPSIPVPPMPASMLSPAPAPTPAPSSTMIQQVPLTGSESVTFTAGNTPVVPSGRPNTPSV